MISVISGVRSRVIDVEPPAETAAAPTQGQPTGELHAKNCHARNSALALVLSVTGGRAYNESPWCARFGGAVNVCRVGCRVLQCA